MDEPTRNLVRQRAGQRCEYCHVPEEAYRLSFHVEHIVASVHQTNDDPSNLAWGCPRCNAHKGTNLATIDPQSGEQVKLFHPREDAWERHFEMEDFVVRGLTPLGRGTVHLLQMNHALRIELRQLYMT